MIRRNIVRSLLRRIVRCAIRQDGDAGGFLMHAFNPATTFVDGEQRYLQTTNTAYEPTGGRINWGTELTIAIHFSAGEVSGLSSRRFFASAAADGNVMRLQAELMSYGTMRYTVKFGTSTRTSIFETTEEFFDDGTDRTIVFSYDGVAEVAEYSINGAAPGTWRSSEAYMPGNATPPDWGEFSSNEYTTYGSAGSDDDVYGRGVRNAEVAQFLVHDKSIALNVPRNREKFYKNGRSVDYGVDGNFIWGEDVLLHIKNTPEELNAATVGGTLTSWAKYGDDFGEGASYSFAAGEAGPAAPGNTITNSSEIAIPSVTRDFVNTWMDDLFAPTAGDVDRYWPLTPALETYFKAQVRDIVDNIYPNTTRIEFDIEGAGPLGRADGRDHYDFALNYADAVSGRAQLIEWANEEAGDEVDFLLYNPPYRNSVDANWASDEGTAAATLNPLVDAVNCAVYYQPNPGWFPFATAGFNTWRDGLVAAKLAAAATYYPGKDVWAMISDKTPEMPIRLTGYQLKQLIDELASQGVKAAYWRGRSSVLGDLSPGVIEVLQGVPITASLPTIDTDPVTQEVALGATLNLTVAGTGVEEWWWFKDGVALPHTVDPGYDARVTGYFTDSLQITNIEAGDFADYTAVGYGDAGLVTSAAAVITEDVPVSPGVVTIAITPSTVNERNTFDVVVTRSGGTDGAGQVFWAATDSICTPSFGSFSWTDGEGGAKSTTVTANDVTADDSTTIGLGSPTNVTLGTPNSGTLNITALAPSITSVTPNTGDEAGGTAITIDGDDFTGATGGTVGGAAMTGFTVDDDNTISATTPAGTVGAQNTIITTPVGASAPATFTYTSAAPSAYSVSDAIVGLPFAISTPAPPVTSGPDEVITTDGELDTLISSGINGKVVRLDGTFGDRSWPVMTDVHFILEDGTDFGSFSLPPGTARILMEGVTPRTATTGYIRLGYSAFDSGGSGSGHVTDVQFRNFRQVHKRIGAVDAPFNLANHANHPLAQRAAFISMSMEAWMFVALAYADHGVSRFCNDIIFGDCYLHQLSGQTPGLSAAEQALTTEPGFRTQGAQRFVFVDSRMRSEEAFPGETHKHAYRIHSQVGLAAEDHYVARNQFEMYSDNVNIQNSGTSSPGWAPMERIYFLDNDLYMHDRFSLILVGSGVDAWAEQLTVLRNRAWRANDDSVSFPDPSGPNALGGAYSWSVPTTGPDANVGTGHLTSGDMPTPAVWTYADGSSSSSRFTAQDAIDAAWPSAWTGGSQIAAPNPPTGWGWNPGVSTPDVTVTPDTANLAAILDGTDGNDYKYVRLAVGAGPATYYSVLGDNVILGGTDRVWELEDGVALPRVQFSSAGGRDLPTRCVLRSLNERQSSVYMVRGANDLATDLLIDGVNLDSEVLPISYSTGDYNHIEGTRVALINSDINHGTYGWYAATADNDCLDFIFANCRIIKWRNEYTSGHCWRWMGVQRGLIYHVIADHLSAAGATGALARLHTINSPPDGIISTDIAIVEFDSVGDGSAQMRGDSLGGAGTGGPNWVDRVLVDSCRWNKNNGEAAMSDTTFGFNGTNVDHPSGNDIVLDMTFTNNIVHRDAGGWSTFVTSSPPVGWTVSNNTVEPVSGWATHFSNWDFL